MRRVLELGPLVGFTGIATFKNGQSVRDTVAATQETGRQTKTASTGERNRIRGEFRIGQFPPRLGGGDQTPPAPPTTPPPPPPQ